MGFQSIDLTGLSEDQLALRRQGLDEEIGRLRDLKRDIGADVARRDIVRSVVPHLAGMTTEQRVALAQSIANVGGINPAETVNGTR